MSPTFQSVLELTLCMLVLVITIGLVCWCCSIVYSFATYGEASRDMARRQHSAPIVVYSHHPEASPTLAHAMNRPPAEVPETSNDTDTTRPCVVYSDVCISSAQF